MHYFHRTESICSKFSETFPLPNPDRICWLPQLGQNRLSPRRSTLTTLQLRASLHIFLQRIWHKLCIICIELRVYFPNLAKHFPYQTQIEYAGPLNLDNIAYLRVAQPYNYIMQTSPVESGSNIEYRTSNIKPTWDTSCLCLRRLFCWSRPFY